MDKTITVEPLTPERMDDYLNFFDHDAFIDNPGWAGCYCYFNQAPHWQKKWEERDAAENRVGAAGLIQQGALRGYLAYLDGKVVGWCNANARKVYTTIEPEGIPEGEGIAAIVCFNVAPSYRGQGIAQALLDAALVGLKQAGLEQVYAFTRTDDADAAANVNGPLRLYQAAGFEMIGQRPPLALMRKQL